MIYVLIQSLSIERKEVLRKIALTFVFIIGSFGLFVNGTTDKGAEQCPPVQSTSSTNCGKDSSLQVELNLLSSKLGVQLDTTCDLHLMETLADWIGTPYRHAGYCKKGIDCSGFVSKIYREVYGICLTHSSRSMITEVKERVKKSELQTGDILFFKIHGKRISHVAIYLKDGYFIHASISSGIMVDRLSAPYYARHYYAAGRILG